MKLLPKLFILIVLLSFFVAWSPSRAVAATFTSGTLWWQIQSIDTMKFSRDLARQELNDPSFDQVIDRQVQAIANTGANYVAIGTPYDEEFVPFLERWVKAARRHGLHVWFRGNFSGWEQWFGYSAITRGQHKQMTQNFIMAHADLFEDGDMFSACPECENGGPGDPRQNGDAEGHRQFLIDEYGITRASFQKIGKNVMSNVASMNGDVAKLIMDENTTKSLGGIVTADHYVATPEQLLSAVQSFATQSGGKVFLGEFGAPIPDIHGDMTDAQQAAWINEVMGKLAPEPELIGVNYWVSQGGSTQIWNNDGSPRSAVAVITKYFKPRVISGVVKKQFGGSVEGVTVSTKYKSVLTDKEGKFTIPVLADETSLTVMDANFFPQQVVFPSSNQVTVELQPVKLSFLDKIIQFIHSLIP